MTQLPAHAEVQLVHLVRSFMRHCVTVACLTPESGKISNLRTMARSMLDVKYHGRTYAESPCKRAVVSSILTGVNT